MMNKILIPVGAIFILGMMSIFTVQQTEKAIKFRLGEVIKDDYEPGLHFKVPFINNIKTYDSRIRVLDSKPERFLTQEKKNVIVDSFVKWKISHVGLFYTTVSGDVLQANLRIDQVMKDAMRSEFSRRDIQNLISTDRQQIRDILVRRISPAASKLGIKIVDVRIKRIDLPKDVSQSVFRRMKAERARVAKEFRSQGAEAAERIRAKADKQREILLAEAYRDAEKLRGEGDAKSADIYAQAYGQEKEFYAFTRSLKAYKKTFRNQGDMVVLDSDSDFFRYFKQEQ